MWRKENKS